MKRTVDTGTVFLAELRAIPSLQDGELFDAYEVARQAMIGKLSNATPAPRYRVTA